MAGIKETPRQKLISLMYLVLMAMLAMNVSGAILDKFYVLDTSLKNSVHERSGSNRDIVSNMAKVIQERGNKADERKAYEFAKEVRGRLDKIRVKLDGIREEVLTKSCLLYTSPSPRDA